MAGFLVFAPQNPSTSISNRAGLDIHAVIVNGANSGAAITAAKALIAKLCNPMDSACVDSWTATQINASDVAGTLVGSVFQGPYIPAGERLRGGGPVV